MLQKQEEAGIIKWRLRKLYSSSFFMAERTKIYTVSELNRAARRILEARFSSIQVVGEVSRPSKSGGHCYFTVKDKSGASISAVLFRGVAARIGRYPEEGASLEIRGTLTLYEKGGRYQIIVEHFSPIGEGELHLRFEALKKKLHAEGLFDEARKRTLPRFPEHICIVTSPTSAAVQDIVRNILNRFHDLKISIIPVAVQGEHAAPQIKAGLEFANSLNPDIIITGRGGGSIEDLWAFNEEIVARAIFHCSTPVISAVGHEIDVSIADFVADKRALTPTHAAELAVPDAEAFLHYLDGLLNSAKGELLRKLQNLKHRYELCCRFRFFQQPELFLSERVQHIISLRSSLEYLSETRLKEERQKLRHLQEKLSMRNPSSIVQARALRLRELKRAIKKGVENVLKRRRFQGAVAMRCLPRQNPERVIVKKRKELQQKEDALKSALLQFLAQRKHHFQLLVEKLDILSPLSQLAKGYAIAMRRGGKQGGKVVKTVRELSSLENFTLRLKDGSLRCKPLPEIPAEKERESLFELPAVNSGNQNTER